MSELEKTIEELEAEVLAELEEASDKPLGKAADLGLGSDNAGDSVSNAKDPKANVAGTDKAEKVDGEKAKDGGTAVVEPDAKSSSTDVAAKSAKSVSGDAQQKSAGKADAPQKLAAGDEIDHDGEELRENKKMTKAQALEQIGKIGEKLELKNFRKLTGDMVIPYIHAGYKIGVLVQLSKAGNGSFESAAKDVAMQVAAMNPLALDQNGIDKETADREVAIAKEQALAEGKPENIVEKIAIGRLNKFYKENTLLNQPFVKNDKISVKKMLEEVDKDLSVVAFERVSLQ